MAEAVSTVPIGDVVNPVRFEPSLPEQPQPAKLAVDVLGQQTEQPSQRQQVTEQPAERPNIVFITVP